MRPIPTDLPAPTAGMLLAKSPTGVIMAFVVLVLALFAQSIPTLNQSLTAASQRAANGEPFQIETVENMGRWGGVLVPVINLLMFALFALFASMFTLAEGSLVTTVVYLVGIAIAWRVFQKKRAAATAEGAVSRTA